MSDNGKQPDPISVDPTKPYIVVTWDDANALHLNFGGDIKYDHMVMAAFFLERMAGGIVDALTMRAQPTTLERVQSIPEAIRKT